MRFSAFTIWKPATYREMVQYQVFISLLSVGMWAWWWFGDPKSAWHPKVAVLAIAGSIMFVLHGLRVLAERRRRKKRTGHRV